MIKIQGKVVLKKGREASARRFHPWIFSGAIQAVEGQPADGEWVEVCDAAAHTLGFGHYQKGTITVRLLTFSMQAPTQEFYREKIGKAYHQRRVTNVVNEFTNCYRLVHGEGDGLSGLILDIYDGVVVMQAHGHGMHTDRHVIAEAIKEILGENVQAIYYKSQHTLAGKTEAEYLLGMSVLPHVVLEHGNKFYIDWEEGQKTGFFLDQRENRKLLGDMSKGARMLNTFCYTGGFSVYALMDGAETVCSVDSSEKAMTLTKRNIELNGFDADKNPCLTMDVFDYLKSLPDQQTGVENPFDIIVLDPPAFAKHKDARHQAMKGYQRLNAEAMRVIKPNGIIFTFSCSQVVDRQLFYDTVVSSAIQAGREIKVLHHLSQPSDHPVSIYHPEGEYLKGLVLYVS
jgi:23S rRNA (cytosine1962-C5)-methyltransferase